MAVRICPTCQTVQERAHTTECEHCMDEVEPFEWLEPNELADMWLGTDLRPGLRAIQQLPGQHSRYRTRSGGRDFCAQLVGIDRLRTPQAWAEAADMLGGLRTRHLARFSEAFELDEYAVVVAEYVHGERLSTRLESGTPLSLRDALSVATQVAVALLNLHMLQHAPSHGRICPETIVLRGHTDAPEAVLTSYGWAAGVPCDLHFPEYYEELSPRSAPTVQDDLFALGSLLFQMVTNVAPMRGRLAPELAEIAPSPFAAPGSFRPELAQFPVLDQLITDLTGASRTRVSSLTEAANRLDEARMQVASMTMIAPRSALSEETSTPVETFAADESAPVARFSSSTEEFAARLGLDELLSEAELLSVAEVEASTLETLMAILERGARVTVMCELDALTYFGASDGTVGRRRTGKPAERLGSTGCSSPITVIDASETAVVAASISGNLLLCGDQQTQLCADPGVDAISVAADAPRASVGWSDGLALVYDLRAPDTPIFRVTRQGSGPVSLTDDGALLRVVDGSATYIFDVEKGVEIARFGRPDHAAPAVKTRSHSSIPRP